MRKGRGKEREAAENEERGTEVEVEGRGTPDAGRAEDKAKVGGGVIRKMIKKQKMHRIRLNNVEGGTRNISRCRRRNSSHRSLTMKYSTPIPAATPLQYLAVQQPHQGHQTHQHVGRCRKTQMPNQCGRAAKSLADNNCDKKNKETVAISKTTSPQSRPLSFKPYCFQTTKNLAAKLYRKNSR